MDVFVAPFSSWSRVNQLEFSSDQVLPRYDPLQHLRQCRVTDIFIDLLAKRLGWNHWSLKRVQNDVYCVNFDLYLENAKAMKKRKNFLLSFVFRFWSITDICYVHEEHIITMCNYWTISSTDTGLYKETMLNKKLWWTSASSSLTNMPYVQFRMKPLRKGGTTGKVFLSEMRPQLF